MMEWGITYAALIAGVLLGIGGLTWLLVRGLRSIPIVHAWNPETHDKITCYALELLRTEEKPSLLGWVIQQWREDLSIHKLVFRDHGFLQLRRGSIDEDMNSDLMVSLRGGWKVPGWFAHQAKDLEGTNGGYHFYNPMSRNARKGLSDPVDIAVILKGQAEAGRLRGMTRPMPSARERAFNPDVCEIWWMDREGRNYSLDDASRYYEDGYLHLAFYAAGRVAHLLQDMAVPAHVRDDAHFGMQGNPADTLEYFAAHEDWRAHGMADSVPNKKRWLYDPSRVWDPRQQQHLQNARSLLDGGDGQLTSLRRGSGAIGVFFDRLAEGTHRQHYSRGTIPGNGDAHDPNHPDTRFPWAVEARPDFTKCRPSPGGLLQALAKLGRLAREMNGVPDGVREFAHTVHAQLEFLEDVNAWLNQYTTHLDACTRLSNLAETHVGGSEIGSKTLLEALDLLKEIDEHLEGMRGLELPESARPLPLDGPEPGLWDHWGCPELVRHLPGARSKLESAITAFQARYLDLEPQLLARTLQGRSSADGMEAWLLDHPDRKRLSALFEDIHGPYCLINHVEDSKDKAGADLALIRRQYDDCESRAIAYTAAFLDRWFESLYSSGQKRGVTVWRNQDAPRRNGRPELKPIGDPVQQGAVIAVSEHACTLGIGNGLPAAVDLELTVAHVQPDERDASYDFARQVFKEGIPVTCVLDQLSGRAGDQGNRPPRETWTKSLSLDDGRPIDITVTGLRPHSMPGVEGLKLQEQGGILREDEEDRLKRIPVVPDSSDGGKLVEAAVLRIEFGDPASGPEQGAPHRDRREEPDPTPPGPQVGQGESRDTYGERMWK